MLAAPSPQPSPPPPLFSSPLSSSPSITSSILLIIIPIIAFAALASLSFHLLLHLLRRRRHRQSSSPPPPSPHTSSATSPPPPILHKSPDCAVCLSPFRPADHLRLLPSCRHAFHLQCIDLWLQSTPSCPLCRSPASPEESPSFQVEIDLPCSLGHSVEHLAGGQVANASPDRVNRTDLAKEGEEGGSTAEIGAEGDGWLSEYLDRMVSSASTSFNSVAFSGGMSSRRFDSGSIESAAVGDGRSWEMEGVDWAEESGLAGIYRWFMGM